MKVILLIFMIPLISFAQGFDWQYSARLPQENPYLFSGLKVQYSLLQNSGAFHLIEELTQCCKFESGTGYDFSTGIAFEYWLKDNYSVIADLSYHKITNESSTQKIYPRVKYNLVTDYTANSDFQYLNLNLAGKSRILNTYFFGAFSLDLAVLLSSNSSFSEIRNPLTPENDPFKDRIDIQNGKIQDLKPILLTPGLSIGYDISLKNDYYLSPQFLISFPLMSVLQNEDLNKFSYGFSITLFRTLR